MTPVAKMHGLSVLIMRKAEYVDGYMTGSFELSDAVGRLLHDLDDALLAIDRQMNVKGEKS